MEEFPRALDVSNLAGFEDVLFTEHLKILRKKLFRHILRRNESDFFDIDAFDRKYVKSPNKTKKMIETVIGELNSLGWKTFLGFGETGLYVYKDQKPLNAY